MGLVSLSLDSRVSNTHAVTRAVSVVYAIAWVSGIFVPLLRQASLAVHLAVGGFMLGTLLWHGFVPWERWLSPAGREWVLRGAVALAYLQLTIVVIVTPDLAAAALVGLTVVTSMSAFMLRPAWHVGTSVAGVTSLALMVVGLDIAAPMLVWTLATGASMAGVAAYISSRMADDARDRDRARAEAERATAALRTVVATTATMIDDDAATVIEETLAAVPRLGLDGAALLLDGVLVRRGGHARHPVSQGTAVAMLAEARDDGRGPAVRSDTTLGWPVVVDDELRGMLMAVCPHGRRSPDEPSSDALRLLADHLGRSLSLSGAIDADRRTLARLRDIDEQRSDFIATVSHELRTPLTVIDGLLQTIQIHRDRLTEDDREHMLERMRANAASLRGIVTSLLDSARLDAGLVRESSQVDLVALVETVVEQLEPIMEEHDVVLDTPGSASVIGDADLLERALVNLFTNAARHTPAGTTVTVTASEHDDELVVVVADDGPGIPADLLPRITLRFVRGGDHRTRETRGLGIGLSLVDQVLRLHSSRLEVSSPPEGGARFCFRLRRVVPHGSPGTDDLPTPHDATAAPRLIRLPEASTPARTAD